MALTIVDEASAELEHLASVEVKLSGVHIGGGIYFTANHNPQVGGNSTAVPQKGLNGEAEAHATTEYDFTLPAGGAPWTDYRDPNPSGPDFVKVGFDISLHVGDALVSTGEFYDGAAVPLLIANDPSELSGTVTITGYPSSPANGISGTLYQTTGTLLSYDTQTVNGDVGGYFSIAGTDVVGGMSGGGNFLDYDADGDGKDETYLIGATSRTMTVGGQQVLQSTSYATFYDELAAVLESLSGDAARTADDFARMVLLSGQTLGSALTTVQGQFFHEDLQGGVNADILLGAGGDDRLFGRAGADSLDGGTGADSLDGGDGGDTMTGGGGDDWFMGTGLGGGAADQIADFEADGDVIDLSTIFETLDDIVAACTEPGDGSIVIDLSQGTLAGAAGGGTLTVLNTEIADLTFANTNVACFAAGTRIATPDGERRVETLRIGDIVVTAAGGHAPVRWIGRQTVHKRAAGPRMQPVRLCPGALGDGLPHSDLIVTADHGMIVDRLVINAAALVNGGSIDWVPLAELPDRVTYYHIETEAHAVVLANGAPAETFIDYAGRQAFDNYAEYAALYRCERIIPEMDRPRISDRRLVPERICRRLGIPADPEPDWSDPGPWLEVPHALAG